MPTPPVDVANSIITQVTKDSENNNGFILSTSITNKDEISIKDASKAVEKKSNQKKLIRSMLCCFGRPRRKFVESRTKIQEENWVPAILTVEDDVDDDTKPVPVGNELPALASDNGNESRTETCVVCETNFLLPSKSESLGNKKCAVIDLDETLVHSSFQPVSNADFIVPVEIEGTIHQVYVLKRPHVDTYLQRMGEMFECILFTASLSKYADPVADLLDKQGVFSARLFRESCVFHRGNYVKDLSLIGRSLKDVIIIDNSPASYIFHPDNAVPIPSWFDDPNDRELLNLLPFLESLAESDDIYSLLQSKGFTSQAKQTTACIQLQLEQQRPHIPVHIQQNTDDAKDER